MQKYQKYQTGQLWIEVNLGNVSNIYKKDHSGCFHSPTQLEKTRHEQQCISCWIVRRLLPVNTCQAMKRHFCRIIFKILHSVFNSSSVQKLNTSNSLNSIIVVSDLTDLKLKFPQPLSISTSIPVKLQSIFQYFFTN